LIWLSFCFLCYSLLRSLGGDSNDWDEDGQEDDGDDDDDDAGLSAA
jgi:hypothetical protein